eukprot:4473886-Amphidinium_carterae.1
MSGVDGGPVWPQPHVHGRVESGAGRSFYGSNAKGLDLAPSWNGEKPETQLAGYLKTVKTWNLVTSCDASSSQTTRDRTRIPAVVFTADDAAAV